MGLGKRERLRVDQPTITGELGPDPDAYTQSARHRVDPGTICGRSCANSVTFLSTVARWQQVGRRPLQV